jgi:hypothetical protein
MDQLTEDLIKSRMMPGDCSTLIFVMWGSLPRELIAVTLNHIGDTVEIKHSRYKFFEDIFYLRQVEDNNLNGVIDCLVTAY